MCSSGVRGLSLEAISIPPANGQRPARLVVALHGWGANAQAVASLVPSLNLPNTQFLIPDAPFSHPQVTGGRMWYDLARDDYRGLEESEERLSYWLNSLQGFTGIPLSSTILCGFSQGGAMALDVGLTLPLAGLASLSGYMHRTPQKVDSSLPSILIVHGRQDTVVPLSAAHRLRDYLLNSGAAVQYRELDMGHEISLELLELLREFILFNR